VIQRAHCLVAPQIEAASKSALCLAAGGGRRFRAELVVIDGETSTPVMSLVPDRLPLRRRAHIGPADLIPVPVPPDADAIPRRPEVRGAECSSCRALLWTTGRRSFLLVVHRFTGFNALINALSSPSCYA
jgi:hypothetical protein